MSESLLIGYNSGTTISAIFHIPAHRHVRKEAEECLMSSQGMASANGGECQRATTFCYTDSLISFTWHLHADYLPPNLFISAPPPHVSAHINNTKQTTLMRWHLLFSTLLTWCAFQNEMHACVFRLAIVHFQLKYSRFVFVLLWWFSGLDKGSAEGLEWLLLLRHVGEG